MSLKVKQPELLRLNHKKRKMKQISQKQLWMTARNPTTMTDGPTEGPVLARFKEQQGLEERKETIRTGEPSKLTLWAAGHKRDQPEAKGKDSPREP